MLLSKKNHRSAGNGNSDGEEARLFVQAEKPARKPQKD
jgi:hypothetical protein